MSVSEKTVLRSELGRRREALSTNMRRAASAQICQLILGLESLEGLRLVAGYRAYGSEVNIDEALAARYPYRASALPINRLEDGTLWNW